MTISHIEKLTESDDGPPKGDHLTIQKWMSLYNLQQDEVADTFGLTQPAIHKMLESERLGKRKRNLSIIRDSDDHRIR